MTAGPIDRAMVEAMLHRGRTSMVEAVIYENGLFHPQMVYDHWHGFADCAAILLRGGAVLIASHDQASDPQSLAQRALASLPDNCEQLSLADMKHLLRGHLVDCALDTVAHHDVNGVVQIHDGVSPVIKANDEPSVARVGGGVHGDSPLDGAIVAQGGAA